ncbi:MAG: hypothetical protein ICV64_00350 [Thermoleophilia bacterium]|nr:hypothetical protein [Thermoleophilia bacterium]
MRTARLLVLAVLALLAIAVGAHAAAGPPRPLANLLLSPGLARAELVLAPQGEPQLLRIDRGVIRSLTARSLVLLQRDGTTTTVPIAAGASVTGRPRGVRRLRRGMQVATLREGSAPAHRVAVLGGRTLPRPLLRGALGPALARADVVVADATAVRLFRVDRGRVVAVAPDSLTLLERDGVTATIRLAPDVMVTGPGRGRRRSAPSFRRGMLVETVRDGDAPAARVHVLRP